MPFDAGSIIGTLSLDASGYTAGINAAVAASPAADAALAAIAQQAAALGPAFTSGAQTGAAALNTVNAAGAQSAAAMAALNPRIAGLIGDAYRAGADAAKAAMDGIPPAAQQAGRQAVSDAEDAGRGIADAMGGGAARGGRRITEESRNGMIEAESIARIFGPVITEAIADPYLAAADLAKEALASIGEAVKSVGDEAEEMNLLSQKTGVAVEQLSELAAAAAHVNISAGELAMGFKFLERNAADAVDGANAKALAAFGQIGISAKQLRDNLNDPLALFHLIRDGLDKVHDASQRTAMATQLLGREGQNLIPLFLMQQDVMQKYIDQAKAMDATTDAAEARMGQNWKDFTVLIHQAWTEIEKTLARPVLQFFGEHAAEITSMVMTVVKELSAALADIFGYLFGHGQQVMVNLRILVDEIVIAIRAAALAIEAILTPLKLAMDLIGGIQQAIGMVSGVDYSQPGGGVFGSMAGNGPGGNGGASLAGGSQTYNTTVVLPEIGSESAHEIGQRVIDAHRRGSRNAARRFDAHISRQRIAEISGAR